MGTSVNTLERIPVSGAVIGYEEKANLIEVAERGWFTEGKYCEEFTKQLKRYINIKYLHLVNSGSSASLLAVSALCSQSLGDRRLKKGDEVITVAAAFPTTINPIIQNGLIPVFVDIDMPSYNINVDLLENAISDKTKAIVLAHTLGNPFNILEVMRIAEKYNLWVIEDCCDALGSKYKEQHVGTFGNIGTLSFYPAHQITTGEGGAVFTNNSELSKIMRSIRDWGRDCICKGGQNGICNKRFNGKYGTLPEGFDHKYIFSELGYNMKMTEMQAAIGVAQMHKIDTFTMKRNYHFAYLKNHLENMEELILPEELESSSASWFGFPITVYRDREKLIKFLDENGIDTRMLFAGNITRHPYFENMEYRVSGELIVTDYVMENTFWIGLHQGITKEMMDHQINTIKEFYTWRLNVNNETH